MKLSIYLNRRVFLMYRLTAMTLKAAVRLYYHFIFPVFGDDNCYFCVSVVSDSHIFICIYVVCIYYLE